MVEWIAEYCSGAWRRMLRSAERVLPAALLLLLLATFAVPAEGNQNRDLPDDCLRRFTAGGSDCGTVTDICTLEENGQQLPQPDEK